MIRLPGAETSSFVIEEKAGPFEEYQVVTGKSGSLSNFSKEKVALFIALTLLMSDLSYLAMIKLLLRSFVLASKE